MLESIALYKSWVVFFGTFFLGESIVLTAAALAAGGVWPMREVAIYAFLGTVVSDYVWFHSSRRGLNWYAANGARGGRVRKMAAFAETLVGDKPHRMLIFVKVLYGIRIATILHLAMSPTKSRTFVIFDTIGTLIWLAVMLPLGYWIGKGLASLGADFKALQIGLAVVVGGMVLWKGWSRWRAARQE